MNEQPTEQNEPNIELGWISFEDNQKRIAAVNKDKWSTIRYIDCRTGEAI